MRRGLATSAVLAVVALWALAGCGSSSSSGSGISDAKIVAALGLTMKAGHYVIDGNPFCSIDKLLGTTDEVKAALPTHRVLASRQGGVGIQVLTPFAPACRKQAEAQLQKLARKETSPR